MTTTMKKKPHVNPGSLMLVVSVALSILFSSCEKITGEGPVVTQDRAVQNFKAVSAGVSGRIYYTVSPTYKLEITAQQNILDILETFVSNGELIIKFRNGVNVHHHEEIVVRISGPSPEGITLSGSASFDLAGTVTGDQLDLQVNGSGNITSERVAVTDRLEATITGSGNITINDGTAKTTKTKISGSGNIQLSGVAAQDAETEISGSGNIRLKAAQNLNARISGSGSVYYLGTPQVSTQISGSGSVRPL